MCEPPPRLTSPVGLLNDPYPSDALPRRPRLIEPGFGHDVHDQAALVAVLGRRDAGDDLHRLHGVGRNLIRVDAALLIGHRLVVDRELRLRVVADRMEEAVRVGHDTWRCQRDHLIQSGRRFERQLLDQALIDVRVRGRVALEQVLGVADDVNAGGRAFERKRQIEDDRDGAADVNVASERLKTLRLDRHVIAARAAGC